MKSSTSFNIIPTLKAHHLPFADLSKIIPPDKKLLQKSIRRFRPNSKNYEDSWGYVIQSTRYGGFKWYDPKSNSLIFFGRKSDSDPTLVVPSFYATPENLAHIIHQIEVAMKTSCTIIKNVNSEEIGAYTPFGFRPYKKTESWCTEARFDDQTFPQIVIDLQKTIEARGSSFQNLRTTLNKNPNVEIKKYKDQYNDEVLRLFAMRDKVSKDFSLDMNGMYFTSHAMYPKASVDKYVIIDKNTHEIIGFTATSGISTETTALVAAIFKPSIRIESVWGIYKTMEIKLHEGLQRINLGGNETKEAFNFMQEKFRPTELLYKTHLIYDPKELV